MHLGYVVTVVTVHTSSASTRYTQIHSGLEIWNSWTMDIAFPIFHGFGDASCTALPHAFCIRVAASEVAPVGPARARAVRL
jgi:hypothetical protein